MATRTKAAPLKSAASAAPSARAVARLTAKTSPLRTQGLTLLVDFVLAQPVKSYVDPARLADWGLAAVDRRTLERAIHEIAAPAWKRHLARTKKSKVKASALVSSEARRMMAQILAQRPEGYAGQLWVRINPLSTGMAIEDLCAVLTPNLHGIILPKCTGPQDVTTVLSQMTQ